MKSWLKSLFGSGELTERHSSSSEKADRTLSESTSKLHELQAAVEEAMAVKDEITGLLAATDDVSRVRAQVAELCVDVSRLEVRTNDFTKMERRIEAISEQGRDLEEEQKSMTRSVESVSKRVGEADAKVTELGEGLEAFALIRKELEDLTGSELTTKVDELKTVVAEAMEAKGEITDLLEPKGDISRVRARVTEFMGEVSGLLEVRSNDLTNMEERIEAISEQGRDLEEEQKSMTRSVESVSKRVGEDQAVVQAAQEAFTSRYNELRSKMDTFDAGVDKANATAARVDKVMTALTERFESERSTLEADGQRFIELRSGVTDLEKRFHELEEAGQLVTEAKRKVDEMSARTASLSGELSRLSEQVQLVEGRQERMSEAQQTATDLAASLSHLEARQSEVRDAVKDLRTLRDVREEVAGGLENLWATRSEIERLQTGQAETSAWLAETHESIRELRAKVEQLDDLTETIDHTREMADRIVAAASDLDERRESFDELEVRMSELRQIGTHLDERTNNLLNGLADADQRFKAVSRNADKADEVRVKVEGITVAVQQAAQQMAEWAPTHESVREPRTRAAQPDDLTANVDHRPEIADRVVAAASDPDERTNSPLGGLSDADQPSKRPGP